MSFKIERILVPVDFSETSEMAISTAASMARLFKAELTILHVVEYKEYYFSVLPEAKLLMPRIEEIKIEAKRRLDEMQSHLKVESGVRPHVIATSGNIEREIRDFATREKMDMIVMGTHGISGYKEIFIGSNAQRVITLSDLPVLTLTKDCSDGFKNILMPFDDSLYSRYKVNIASVIAEAYGAHVHILGILDTKDPDEMRKMKIKIHQVEGVIAGLDLQFTTNIVIAGNMAKTAMAYATENNCDLMVINTGHESEITGVFLGAFAQQIVNHANIPVLSVKPIEGSYSGGAAGSGV